MVLLVKNSPANAGDIRDTGSIPGSGRSPGGGNGNSLQYSCLENPMDRGAGWATVHGVAKSQKQLKSLSTLVHSLGPLIFHPLYQMSWSQVLQFDGKMDCGVPLNLDHLCATSGACC